MAAGVLLAGVSSAGAAADSGKVTAVRFWSLGDVTRIAIEVSSEFTFRHSQLSNPERLFFDIHGARPELARGERNGAHIIVVGDGTVEQIRVAETQPDVTRIVVDLARTATLTTSQLSNPSRLMIELRSKDSPSPPSRPGIAGGRELTLLVNREGLDAGRVPVPSQTVPAKAVLTPSLGLSETEGSKSVRAVQSREPKSEPRKFVPPPAPAKLPPMLPEVEAPTHIAALSKGARLPVLPTVLPRELPPPSRRASMDGTARTAGLSKAVPVAAVPAALPRELPPPSGTAPADVAVRTAGLSKAAPAAALPAALSGELYSRSGTAPVDVVAGAAHAASAPAALPRELPPPSSRVPVDVAARTAGLSSATHAAPVPAALPRELPSPSVAPPGIRPAPGRKLPATQAAPAKQGDRSLTRALGLKLQRVVLDAGHGGSDVGTHGQSGFYEKDLTLDVAQRLGALIEQRMGSEVVYTRPDDSYVGLEERTRIANQHEADLFLSIHANSSPSRGAAGVETYILNFTTSKTALELAARENATSESSIHELHGLLEKIALRDKIDESREFAARLQTSLAVVSSNGTQEAKNRGVKSAPFVVLIGAEMPSVLAEIGFLTNSSEELLLRKPEHRQRIAEALYKGIASYAETLSRTDVARK